MRVCPCVEVRVCPCVEVCRGEGVSMFRGVQR